MTATLRSITGQFPFWKKAQMPKELEASDAPRIIVGCGTQGYELQDADGLLRLTFQTVNLSNTGEVTVALDVFLQETGWEADDLVNIYVETDQGIVTLLDSTGQDIDDLGIEGAWMTLETSLGADIDSARLVVELDSNASSESLFIDNVGIFEPVESGDDTTPAEVTLISAVQGSGDASTMEGDEVTVEGRSASE